MRVDIYKSNSLKYLMDEERKMVQGDWKCSKCEKEITELPFQPAEGQEVFCRECYSAGRPKKSFGQRQMIQGDWACSECKKPITELPFQPSGDRPLFCKDCYRSQR